MNDLISRLAAIDEIEERKNANGYRNVAVISELNRLEGYIMRLPSAQPEIVRCKDCKWFNDYEVECSLSTGLVYVTSNDYCSKGERKER